MVFLEDVTVGDKASFGNCHVDRDEVIAFAERFDPQPFHLSDEAAAATHFGRLSASGWHTASMTMAMIVAYYRETGFQSLGSPGVDELRWLKPVYPGDTLRCETEVLETRTSASRPEMGFVISQLTVFNQGDVAVMRFRPTLLVRTKPAG
ncbi:MaoC family dehydratase [Sphingomonas pseudosanguinis]|uniref:Acyl dehydratase n=1 Tax=Sphingomonas pseudosanguinis TaxID=413712 RepID=A0A7W6F4C1_9SPHN|nr:MaoC family dehydratase [Sphingomonas pseudosanguinis]MBB3880723.1 acyl dehydratase [Sphingomonas pseudosanguinis]MBN3535774.1 MaoC family dehydratase [Sphingomonas pseudosanguinis]